MPAFLSKYNVQVGVEEASEALVARINQNIAATEEDPFFIADLGDVVKKWHLWNRELPTVEPHYAVKCNDDLAVLSVLDDLGAGFDCASKEEIKKVLGVGVSPDRIIYANPCKQSSHIKYAAKKDVKTMTFDNESELYKVKQLYPDAHLVLRILPPEDTKCQCPLGMKFGIHPNKAAYLLKKAQELDLNVVGVSFHVGSGCYDPKAWSLGVVSAANIFQLAKDLGFNFSLLDIGGGFPGFKNDEISFEEICVNLRQSLEMYFPASSGVRVIAEPGRFFVASAFSLAVNVISRRVVARDVEEKEATGEVSLDDEPMFMYYVNDGVYGSFNCLMYDHATVQPKLFNAERFTDQPTFESSIWGPTCDGLDCISQKIIFPELQQGDWIYFDNMGAYTCSAASTFNGMPKPHMHYVITQADWDTLSEEVASCQCPTPLKMKKGRKRTLSSTPCTPPVAPPK